MPHNAVGAANQVEAVRLLLSRLEHELRSPLQAVDGFARLLRDRVPPELEPLVDYLCAGVAQLTGLVDELAAVGRGIEPAPDGLAMGEVVERTRAVTGPSAQARRVALQFDCADASLPTPAALGATRTTQVLVNLVSNAVAAAPEGSTVRVEVARHQTTWTFTVSDEGPGVALDDRQAIFEPFQRRTTRPGSGLGLYIVKTLIDGAGGTIGVHAGDDGRGAHFVVQVPEVPVT